MRALTPAPLHEPTAPRGFLYVPDLVSPAEERELLAWFAASPAWKEITFRGQTARRRAMAFGARYLTQGRRLMPAPPLPLELVVYRDRMVDAACVRLGRELALVGRRFEDFALCTALRYPPGAGIGWHADSPAYGPTVLSLSLGAAACLQLRRSDSEDTNMPFELVLARRSLFVLAGEARTSWMHRVLPVREERYSLTVRCRARRPSNASPRSDRWRRLCR